MNKGQLFTPDDGSQHADGLGELKDIQKLFIKESHNLLTRSIIVVLPTGGVEYCIEEKNSPTWNRYPPVS